MSSLPPNVFVVSAPSGSGKSTVLSRVLEEVPGIRFSVSHTTRPSRPGERDGVEYRFVSRAEFDRLRSQGLLLEWAEVHGELYGTAWAEYEAASRGGKDLLLDLDVQGFAQVRHNFKDAVSVFIFPPSRAALERRLRGRGQDNEATIRRRLQGASEEMSLYSQYDYAIVNDGLEECVASLKAVIRAARCRTSRVSETALRIISTFHAVSEKEK